MKRHLLLAPLLVAGATTLSCNCGSSSTLGDGGSTGDSGNEPGDASNGNDSGNVGIDSGSGLGDSGNSIDAGIDAGVAIGSFCMATDPPLDAGPAFDSGSLNDGGSATDAGTRDGGALTDGGTSTDSGVSLDGGPQTDGGAKPDGGSSTDAGRLDAGLGVDAGLPCPSGQSCVAFCGASGGFCTTPCTTTCAQGNCVTIGTSSVCVIGCAKSSDCPMGQVCGYDPADQMNLCMPDCRLHPDVCWASGSFCSADAGTCDPSANSTFGEPCSACGGGCAPGYDCLGIVQPGTSYCSQVCGTGSPCPTSPPGARCVAQSALSGDTYCGWTCTGPTDTSCPTGLTCQAVVDGGYLCQ
jgi:hypothetical protein